MSTAEWRYEKASSTVRVLCRLLQSQLTEDQRADVFRALHDSLKLVCDAVTADKPERGDLWTPGLVSLFFERPVDCERWLELLDEEDFKPEYYSKPN